MIGKMKNRRLWKIGFDLACVYIAFFLAFAIPFRVRHPMALYSQLPGGQSRGRRALSSGQWIYGHLQGKWKYASFDEAVNIVASSVLSYRRSSPGSRHIPERTKVRPSVHYGNRRGAFLFAMESVRLIFRFISEKRMRTPSEEGRNVLLIGAGEAGEMIARDMLRHPELGLCSPGLRG